MITVLTSGVATAHFLQDLVPVITPTVAMALINDQRWLNNDWIVGLVTNAVMAAIFSVAFVLYLRHRDSEAANVQGRVYRMRSVLTAEKRHVETLHIHCGLRMENQELIRALYNMCSIDRVRLREMDPESNRHLSVGFKDFILAKDGSIYILSQKLQELQELLDQQQDQKQAITSFYINLAKAADGVFRDSAHGRSNYELLKAMEQSISD